MANVTIMDKIRNDASREQLGVEINANIIGRTQLQWWGHLNRLQQNIQTKKIREAKKIDKRRRGRLRKT